MRDIVYLGPANIRVLGEDDFAKMGVEHKHDIEFTRGVKQEVSDKIAEKILSHPIVLGEFVELEPEAETEEVVEVDSDPDGKSDDDEDSEPTPSEGETVHADATAASENADGHPQASAESPAPRPRSNRSQRAS